MSESVEKFIKKNNISKEIINKSIFDVNDINRILGENLVTTHRFNTNVCIKDIVGFDYSWRGDTDNLLYNFNKYFDNDGDLYHSRDNGMLEYSTYEMPTKLVNSFLKEPITVIEIENGKCVIESNGIHRFHILKVSYLNEISKCKNDYEKREIDKLFTIPVEKNQVDILKSYSCFMLNNYCINNEKRYWIYVDRKNPDISIISVDNEKIRLTDEELIEFVKKNVNVSEEELEQYRKYYPSFNDYVNLIYSDKKERSK
ncbi:MAG: hypothetical protein PUD59_05385 [bacterium]|nr:hypothetical protein [bacterium]